MNIQIVTLAMTATGQGAYYNTQDVGLGRALVKCGHTVDIYKFIKEESSTYTPEEKLAVHYVHSRSIGSHSVNSYSFITESCDAVICFSDNQIGFARLKKRCERLHIPCLPYVGVIGSNSTSRGMRTIKNLLASNMRHYRNMTVLAKTPQIKKALEQQRTKEVILAPVGLDESLLHADYARSTKQKLREQLGLPVDGKILLFLARMTEEKRPLAMAELFAQLHTEDESYHLVVIGKGSLKERFEAEVARMGLQQAVTSLEQIPNAAIWQYFCAADVFVNLNTQEIFGMAILEAMYYECAVVARRAPGPEYIISDQKEGILCEEDAQICDAVKQLCGEEQARSRITERAHDKIVSHFLWNRTAELIMKEIQGV